MGFDIGGTFTDLALIDNGSGEVTTEKVETTPDDLSRGVMRGIRSCTTTRPRNPGVRRAKTPERNHRARLRRRGDIDAARRGGGPGSSPVDRRRWNDVDCRLSAELVSQPRPRAADTRHRHRGGRRLRDHVVGGHARDTGVRTDAETPAARLRDRRAGLRNAGEWGIVDSGTLAQRSLQLINSGPAAGVIGARRAAREFDCENIITLDIGGTSADACIVRDGEIETTTEGDIDDLPLLFPQTEVRTVGAGGTEPTVTTRQRCWSTSIPGTSSAGRWSSMWTSPARGREDKR